MNRSDESSSYKSSISMNKQPSENEEDNQEIENDDDNDSSEDMEMEDAKRQSMKCTTNITCATSTTSAKTHKDNASDSKGMIFSKKFIDKEDQNLVTKLCNSKAIFDRFRIWMNKAINLVQHKLQHELFLLNPLLVITPKT